MIGARSLLALLVVALGSGCTQVIFRVVDDLDLEAVETLRVGRSDVGDALAALGAPLAVDTHGDGIALVYEEIELDEEQVGLGLSKLIPSVGVDAIKLSYGSSDSVRSAAVLVFDGDGVLEGVAARRWKETYGRAGALQLVVTVQGVVDSGSLRAPPRALWWGGELLRDLQQTMNTQHLPDAELRGSRGRAGQYALGW